MPSARSARQLWIAAVLIVANVVGVTTVATKLLAQSYDDGRCDDGACHCEFEGTAGGWCSRLGYGTECTKNGACGVAVQ